MKNKHKWMSMPTTGIPQTAIDPDTGIPWCIDTIEALCEKAKGTKDLDLVAFLNDVNGVYSVYEGLHDPQLADMIIERLITIINYLIDNPVGLKSAVSYDEDIDLDIFVERCKANLVISNGEFDSVADLIVLFVIYMELLGKSNATINIYKGKIEKAISDRYSGKTVNIYGLADLVRSILNQAIDSQDKDNNFICALRLLLKFIELLMDALRVEQI